MSRHSNNDSFAAPLLPATSFFQNSAQQSGGGGSVSEFRRSSFARDSFAKDSNTDTEMRSVRERRKQQEQALADYNRRQLRLVKELRQHMEEKMTTDVFALFAAVLRKRAGVIDMSKTEQVLWDTMMRKKDLQIAAYSFFGLAMSIVTATMFWEFGGSRHTTLPEVTQDQLTLLYCSQLGLTASTLVCMVLIFQKYQLLLMNKRMEWAATTMYDLIQAEENEAVQSRYLASYSFWRSSLRVKLVTELVVHLLHPLIWMNTDETAAVYEAFQILIFARLYLVVNIIFKFSQSFQRRREIISNNLELQRTGYQPSIGGTWKMLFYANAARTTLALMVASLAILGFIVFIMERSVARDSNPFRKLENALWFAFVTFSTVGYGDMVPVTAFGRLSSVAIGAIGVTTVTVFGGVVTNLMVQSREQRAVSQYLSETDVDQKVESSAARVIQLAYLYSKAKTKDIVNPWLQGGHKSNVVYGAIKDFKKYRWQKSQTQSSTNDPVTDSKINNVNHTLNKAQLTLQASSQTMKATRNAVRSFMQEMNSVLGSSARFDASSSTFQPMRGHHAGASKSHEL
jgi:hypothetical protein